MPRKRNQLVIKHDTGLVFDASRLIDLLAKAERGEIAFPVIPELDQILRDYAKEVMRVVMTREITHPLERARAKILKWVAKELSKEAE